MSTTKSSISRRTFLSQTSLMGVACFLSPWQTPAQTESFPVVETVYGKVRGMDVTGIKTFRGIRYGASTSGVNRFMPPVKPNKWMGIVDAMAYGPASPQKPGNPTDDYTQAVNWDAHVKPGLGEDCLSLNLWTPGVQDNQPRPVFFYIHGGGFNSGSGAYPFDGDPMARLGNAVVITVNHRLGPLGYLDLYELGWPIQYKHACVAGMMDLVAALEWVRDNVANFGGDPRNVMILGQSGGGAKTSLLLAMPSAKGLFHKAAIQSGSSLKAGTKEESKVASDKLARELGMDRAVPDAIQKIHWSTIIEAKANTNFQPVVDGEIVPHHPFDPEAPKESSGIPLIVGYTLEDAAFFGGEKTIDTMEALRQWTKETYSEKADQILKTYLRVYPNAAPFRIRARIATDAWVRIRATKMAERKAREGAAPVYFFLMAWPSPSFEGKFGAVHGVDLGFVLADPRIPVAGNTPGARKMAKIVGSAFAAFARTGDPNCSELPHWQPYDIETRSVMVFDDECRLENDPSREIRLLWEGFDP